MIFGQNSEISAIVPCPVWRMYAIQSSDLGVLFECCIRKQPQLEGMDEKAASCHQGVF